MSCQNIRRLPSQTRTLWMGFRNRKARYSGAEEIPKFSIRLRGFTVNDRHLTRYKALCELNSVGIPLFYPLTLAYPIILRLLSQKGIPFSMFRMLNRKITISQTQPLSTGVPFDIDCAIASHTIREKGIDLHVTTHLSNGEEILWSCTNTFYFKGRIGATCATNSEPDGNSPLSNFNDDGKDQSTSWFLPDEDGFRFARVCGDSNGVHYSHRYAKILGFEGAFAQPLLVLDRCFEKAGWGELEEEMSATVRLKGQLYYGRELTLNYSETNGRKAFELFCEGNGKTCISGVLKG